MGQQLGASQWLGVFVGLSGVLFVVWHKIDVRAVSVGSLFAVGFSLVAITSGTLYQRVFCPTADLRSSAFIQFGASLLVLAPLAYHVEGFVVHWSWPLLGVIAYLVILASILARTSCHSTSTSRRR
jgi:drug/metabolite transporter (DMT)-like permease